MIWLRFSVMLASSLVTSWYVGSIPNIRHIFRLILEDTKKIMIVPAAVEPPFDRESRYQMETVNDLYVLKDSLIASANRFVSK